MFLFLLFGLFVTGPFMTLDDGFTLNACYRVNHAMAQHQPCKSDETAGRRRPSPPSREEVIPMTERPNPEPAPAPEPTPPEAP